MRNNAFVAMCKFEDNVKAMAFDNCDLFKWSFTTKGMGYTFNNEQEEILIKNNYRSTEFLHNVRRKPSLMKSTNSRHSLTVIIDSNAEEVESYEIDSKRNDFGIVLKPIEILVSLHSPIEPADNKIIPSTSLKIPLGSSTTFLITPRARKIDERAAKDLTEFERQCRLNTDTNNMDIFNIYTRVSCLFECKMRYAKKRCGCIPWNYPIEKDKVRISYCSFIYSNVVVC